MAAPVAYRTSDDKFTPSFPPVVYYRDTFGLDGIRMDGDLDDNDSIATRSTVRTTMNIYPHGMQESGISRVTNASQPYQVEQVATSRVVTAKATTLLRATAVAFGSALQLLMLALISVFFDGCPYFASLAVCCILLIDTIIILTFAKCCPTIGWLWASSAAALFSLVLSVLLFFWTAFLINSEDKFLEKVGARENRIVTSTRIAMYSLEMFFTPIHAIAASVALYCLYPHLSEKNNESVTRAYFLSEPPLGHQKILVPIELRQMRSSSDTEPDQASIGVQTSGTRTQQI